MENKTYLYECEASRIRLAGEHGPDAVGRMNTVDAVQTLTQP